MPYYDFKNELPEGFNPKECPTFDVQVKIDSGWSDAEHKILYVLQHVDSQDLKSGALLSTSPVKETHRAIVDLAKTISKDSGFKPKRGISEAVINFNFFKTYHLKSIQQESAEKDAAARVSAFIERTKPTVVVIFGDAAAQSLLPKITDLRYKRGWPHKATFGSHKCTAVSTLSFDRTYYAKVAEEDEDGEEGEDDVLSDFKSEDKKYEEAVVNANLVGFIARNVATAFAGELVFKYAEQIEASYKLVNTMKKFDRLLEILEDSPVIAVDCETTGLTTYQNSILTLQFAITEHEGYVLPLYHRDSPFSAPQLKQIQGRLKEFFGQRRSFNPKKPKYLLGQNFGFDLRILRQWLGLPVIYLPVWDVTAGEFCFHPDTLVSTENGKLRIADLVDMPEVDLPRVWTYNTKTGQAELKPIIGRSKHSTSDRMMELYYNGGRVRVTENHRIWSNTRNAYVAAKDLQPGEDIVLLK